MAEKRATLIGHLKALSGRRIAGSADYTAIVKEMNAASDRAKAIVYGSLVEDRLRTALAARMNITDPKQERRVFEDNGALASFFSKIGMAFAINLIGQKSKEDLEIIKETRNAFAHSMLPLSFDQEDIRKVMALLHAPEAWSDPPDNKHPRLLFQIACMYYWSELWNKRNCTGIILP